MKKYKITTNIVNGKSYVGSHGTNNLKDGYKGSGRTLIKAFEKYGRKKFKRRILKECKSIEDARKH